MFFKLNIFIVQFHKDMIRTVILLLFIHFIFSVSYGQELVANIKVDAGGFDRHDVPVTATLDGIDLDIANRRPVLFDGVHEISAIFHFENGPRLSWVIPELKAGIRKVYQLKLMPLAKTGKDAPVMEVAREHGNLIILSHGKKVLQYNFVEDKLPDGTPEVYKRAGYIHPLWSPGGEVLTRIRPPDHLHHVGLWNPWTRTEFKGREIDFWNLNKQQGTVRPVTVTVTASNDVFAEFKVIHDHVVLKTNTPSGEETVLKEEWNVRVWNIPGKGWLIDFISTLNCATDSAFTIKKYRYEGFGFRATAKWNDETATILTSEGYDKANGNGTRCYWCDVNGISSKSTSGIVFITHPANYNYPEPIRIWPVGANKGKENVFFNFNPAMDRDWRLKPEKVYQLRYRMYVYDGKTDKNEAERLWRNFAYPPSVSVEIMNKK